MQVPEITAKLAQRGARFYEVGVPTSGQNIRGGQKDGFRDALRAFYVILKYNLFKREKHVAEQPLSLTFRSSSRLQNPFQ